jgi:LCP family protein required for cell wall assembly
MLSIPRDSYVNIVGKGKQDKITHAYSFGGLDMATETVEELLEIDIDHHLVLNFSSFTSIIDTLGGIEVEVPFAFSEQNSKGVKNAITFEEGTHTLNGEEALAFARMRKQDPRGDIGRGERQQQVITAVVSKLLSIGSVPKYGSLFGEVKDGIDTDVNILDIPKLAPYLSTFSEINPVSLEGEGIKLNGIYYYQLNENTLYNAKQELN